MLIRMENGIIIIINKFINETLVHYTMLCYQRLSLNTIHLLSLSSSYKAHVVGLIVFL